MYILGASGHARVIIDIIEGKETIHGIFDDDPQVSTILDYSVNGSVPDSFFFDEPLFLAIGDNTIRKKLYHQFQDRAKFATLIHSTVYFSKRASLKAGSVIMEGAIVKVNSVLGKQVIVNTGASIDHDCLIGDFAHIAPQATLCGGIEVGEGSLIGANSTILPGIKIGAWCRVGAGSVVISDVPDGETWIGKGPKGKSSR